MATGPALPTVSVVIPNWNGGRWLPECLESLAAQTLPPDEVVIVDNGSTDGSSGLATVTGLRVRVIELGRNTGFAFAANRGIDALESQAVALVNTDVTLAPDWIARMAAALARDDRFAAVACKMLDMRDPQLLYDAGDLLRRDGACEQRGRFESDDGRFDSPGEVFAPCAGAAVYRRTAVTSVGGFDERLFSYIEDVDLGLRLRLAGWHCAYEPVVALHAAEGSSWQLRPPVEHWIERNTLLLVAKTFPLRWAPYVIYRQLAWALHALLERRLRAHLGGALAALPLMPHVVRERRRLRRESAVPIETAVPPRPIRRASGAPAAKRPRDPRELR
ncbi:MAG: glycosyltransferase family 2 protein [Acetobacteraceae bacterium]|nr:glycosyltransferase family 2 protein [Acetobacteraceae bacterium]